MDYAITAILGAAAVWLTQALARKPPGLAEITRYITSPDHPGFFYTVSALVPEDMKHGNMQVDVQPMVRDIND